MIYNESLASKGFDDSKMLWYLFYTRHYNKCDFSHYNIWCIIVVAFTALSHFIDFSLACSLFILTSHLCSSLTLWNLLPQQRTVTSHTWSSCFGSALLHIHPTTFLPFQRAWSSYICIFASSPSLWIRMLVFCFWN